MPQSIWPWRVDAHLAISRKVNVPWPWTIERPEQQKHAQDKAEVADPINDKSLIAGPRIVMILVPETDQSIGAQPYSLPTDKHQKQIVAHDEDQHGGGEEIEKSKEAPIGSILVHVACRIDMDQAADTGHDQDHDGGKRVDQEGHIDLQRSESDPGVEIVDQEAFFGLESLESKKGGKRKCESDGNRGTGNEADRPFAHPFLYDRPQ